MTPERTGIAPGTRAILLLAFFASGAAALVYEVLWLKELGRLFGVTAHAAATTLAVFFLGLSVGNLVWGRRSARLRRPLRAYAWLEVGIAATALLWFGLLAIYHALYPQLFRLAGDSPALFLGIKFLLALVILFPPAFFMGGTLPVMGQYLIRAAENLGRSGAVLYAVNTFGGAAGALAAGFYLPLALGFRGSYALAILLNLVVAAVAFWWSRGEGETGAGVVPPAAPPAVLPAETVRPGLFWSIAAGSGFLTLALEVLWTRMFAQVLQNSVYTFAVILTVFLVALALGSALAHALCRMGAPPLPTLFGLLVASGVAVGAVPLIFARLNPGLGYLAPGVGWSGYVAAVFGGTAAVLLIPGILIGSVFPYLLRLAEGRMISAGRTLGQLASVNTFAAILGSLAAGFLILDLLGLWNGLRLIALGYFVLALAIAPALSTRRRWLAAAAPLAGILLLSTVVSYRDLALVRLDPDSGEELVDVREGAHGIVAVIRRGDDLRLKVDNSYLLGTSKSTPNLRLQSWIPLSIHPAPRDVFYLGMGTGITAGGALDLPVEQVTVAELNPDVVDAARTHFRPYLNGLFEDPRVRVVADDGRAMLAGTPEQYDAIIADIFLTFRAGVGSLYTREHFETVRSRLKPGGLFAQWLPAFELSEREFGIIARTMLEVFPQVTVWRRGFSPRFSLLALIGQNEVGPLDGEAWRRNLDHLRREGGAPEQLWFLQIPAAAYIGNLSGSDPTWRDYPLATDDRPLVEYLSPIVNRENWGAQRISVLAGGGFARISRRISDGLPPARDPFLAELSEGERLLPLAGLRYYEHVDFRQRGENDRAAAALAGYRRYLGESTAARVSP